MEILFVVNVKIVHLMAKKVNASVLKTVRGGNIVFDINNSRAD
jgi:hypothetical protein